MRIDACRRIVVATTGTYHVKKIGVRGPRLLRQYTPRRQGRTTDQPWAKKPPSKPQGGEEDRRGTIPWSVVQPGGSAVKIMGAGDYSPEIWLPPDLRG